MSSPEKNYSLCLHNVLNVNIGEANNNQDIALARYKQASNLLKQMLKFDLQDSVITQNTLEYKIVIVDPEKAIQEGLKNRSEIRETEIQVELAKIDIRRQRAKGMINGSITGSYNVVGNDNYSLWFKIPHEVLGAIYPERELEKYTGKSDQYCKFNNLSKEFAKEY